MAMGQRSRREAENAIACCRPFRNSTGSMKGTRGSTRTLGWLESHEDARRIRELLSRAVYVVWSYGTPISWVTEGEDGERTAYYVEVRHSATTSNHQSIAQCGMSEYETIGSDRPRERRYALARRRAEAYTPQQAARELGQPVPDGDMSPEEIYARTGRTLVGSPGYQNGFTEDDQEANLRRLLDPRFADPDWTPFRSPHGNLPPGAEDRDLERINREERTMDRGWTP